jgi:hypothetical protein
MPPASERPEKTMNEPQFGSRIRHILNQGTQLDPRVADRLARAREIALSRQRTERVSVLRWADNVLGTDGSEAPAWQAWARVLVPAAALIVAVAGIYSWQENQRLAEIVEIDAQLLADDLPIDAYLDRGFQNWLKKRAAGE